MVRKEARKVGDHPVVETGARIGYAASAVLHLLLGWLALRMAWGNYGGDADQSGAFEVLGSSTGGVVVLVVLAAGFVLLGAWNLLEAVVLHDTKDRVKYAAKGVTYGVLAWGAFEVAGGTDTSSSQQSEEATATLLAGPLGGVLVVLLGAVVVAVGGYLIYKGLARKFREDLRKDPGRAVEVLGMLGYAAKGVSLIIVGVLFWSAAATHDPEKASGLDGALHTVLQLPWGQVLLSLVAVGLVAYAAYSFARSRYARV